MDSERNAEGSALGVSCVADVAAYRKIVAAIEAFRTELFDGRFVPTPLYTYCNQFAEAVLEKLDVPRPPKGLLANEQGAWFIAQSEAAKRGEPSNWIELDGEKWATEWLAAGLPVVASYVSEGPHGHIAIGRLTPDEAQFAIAQAGKENFICGFLRRGFGNKPVKLFGLKT